jgi:hypothetical protein
MLNKLVKLANELDKLGLESGANEIDNIIVNCAGMFDFFKREKEISPEIRSAVEKYFNKINEDSRDGHDEVGPLGELVEIKTKKEDGLTTYEAIGEKYTLDCWIVAPEGNEEYKKRFGAEATPTAWVYGVPIEGSDDRIYGEW